MTLFKILTIKGIIAVGLLMNLCAIPAEKGRDNMKESWLKNSNFELGKMCKVCN